MEIRNWNEIIGKNEIRIEIEFFQNRNNAGYHWAKPPPPPIMWSCKDLCVVQWGSSSTPVLQMILPLEFLLAKQHRWYWIVVFGLFLCCALLFLGTFIIVAGWVKNWHAKICHVCRELTWFQSCWVQTCVHWEVVKNGEPQLCFYYPDFFIQLYCSMS